MINFGRTVLQQLSMHIAPGEKIGLVGQSGAGKSTIVNLILRYFNANAGRILIDGQDIQGVTQESLRAQIAVIPQDTMLFHRTLMENIRYGSFDKTDEAAIEASKQAHLHEFIMQLPEHYQTVVGERGIKLSGGQRQRKNKMITMIAIAHRLSTLKHMDRIIVLEKGQIVDEGTHDHLLNHSSLYKHLWKLQAV